MKIFLRNSDLFTEFLSILDLTMKSGGVGYGTVGLHTIYAVSDPEDSLTVLKSCAEKGFFYDMWKPWLGDVALFTGPANVNQLHRKLFLPMISPKKLESFIEDFNHHANRFVLKMTSRVDTPPFDILRDLLIYNLEIFCTTLFGLPDIHKEYDFNAYCDSVAAYLRIAITRFMNLLYHNENIYSWSRLKKLQDKEVKVLHDTSSELIRRRKKLYDKEKQENSATGRPMKDVYIDMLAEGVERGFLTETEMREEIDTIIFGGHDTTAFTTLYTMVLLGSHPQAQEKVYQEVKDILGNSEANITKEDLSKMVYLEACIKESMRLYPYGAVIGKKLDKDVKLRTCTLREGGSVLVFVWGVHRHSSWGPDVSEYSPERWLKPDKLPRPVALLGFSEGPRACLGRKYAMLSMKTLLAAFVRRYRIRADHTQLQFELLGVLQPKAGHYVALEARS
ncbi:cytochrome p450 domain-containing protein [Phthorimaea operculella]|nr:cytochrome p450 domain-containing protein [Phthorimaea operculella]